MTPEIPEYHAQVLAPRRSRYAVVLPVINEGARIRRQIERIRALNLDLDMLVADGGSTDGSLDREFLERNGVRALLVKTGPGKLGAQLRIAYAWSLEEGYEGVVTVDGNGKDGVEAIPRFTEALAAGFDYVQGSRYMPGGRAVNTPAIRHLAGRFVHAPILSLAARRRYSDTTNGFRAYSSGYLRDPRVRPFRAVFDRYSLLFYLTVRASQLGFRTLEIPVDRVYPPSGPVPTKIRGFAGYFDMLGELLGVALGRYNPPRH